MSMIKIFVLSKKGAMSIEYALIVFVIGIGLIVGLHKNKQAIIDKYCEIGDQLNLAGDQLNQEYTTLSAGCRRRMAANVIVNGPFRDSGVFLTAGQTVEITPNGQWLVSQYGTRETALDPFNSMNGVDATKRISVANTTLNGYRISAFGASIKPNRNENYDTGYISDPATNTSLAQNGKVRITAQKNGYLYMGIHDDYAGDNGFFGGQPSVSVYLVE